MKRFIHLSRTASIRAVVATTFQEMKGPARVSQPVSRRKARVSAWLAALTLVPLLFAGVFGPAGSVEASRAQNSGPATPPQFRFPAYFIEWGVYDRNYVPADIPADIVTHLNYAFINPVDIDSDGMFECDIIDDWAAEQKPMQRVVPGTDPNLGENLGTINQLRVLRRNHPNLQVLMSLGGWTLSENFPVIASTPAQRTHFAESCVEFMQEKHFDGIDVDWEFPAMADRDNFTALLQTFRDELDELTATTGQTYPLTIAGPPGQDQIAAIDSQAIGNILDWVNVMSYDFGGGWDSNTGHNAPLCASPTDPHGALWNASGTIQKYLSDGLPPGKLHLGLPYYGRAFQHLGDAGPNPAYPGRFAPVTPGDYVTGTWDHLPPYLLTGVFDYWDIKDRFTGPFQASTTPVPGVNNYTRYWDNEQSGPFVFRPDAVGSGGQGRWVGFDDPQSLTHKVHYARTLGLGGVFIWELSQEGHPGTTEWPLSTAIGAAISGPP